MSSIDTRDYFDLSAERSSVWLALAMTVAVIGAMESGDTRPYAIIALVGLISMLGKLRRIEPPRVWTPTVVTLLRAFGTCALAFAGPLLPGAAIAAVIYAVFCADGLDGYLARKLDAASRVGARIDMESDAFLVMTACVLHALRGPSGLWVLIPGLLRYGYVLFVAIFGARGEAPRSTFARYAFGVSITALTIGFLPLAGYERIGPMVATGVLIWSFGRSFYWSFRGRG